MIVIIIKIAMIIRRMAIAVMVIKALPEMITNRKITEQRAPGAWHYNKIPFPWSVYEWRRLLWSVCSKIGNNKVCIQTELLRHTLGKNLILWGWASAFAWAEWDTFSFFKPALQQGFSKYLIASYWLLRIFCDSCLLFENAVFILTTKK